MIKYFIFTDYIHILVSSILIYTLIPKHNTLVRGLNMDHLMPLSLRYVSFSYLSKVKSGGKVVHWTLTLSQDSCSRDEPMHLTHLSSLLLSCPYL